MGKLRKILGNNAEKYNQSQLKIIQDGIDEGLSVDQIRIYAKEICILMVKKQLMKKCDIVTAKEDITK